MPNDEPIAKVISALERTLGDTAYDEFSDLKSERPSNEFHFAFHGGEAGGIAASSGLFGVKALEMCDDISDAVEGKDAEFLRLILKDLKQRPDVGAATNAEPRSTTSLTVLAASLAEAVMAHRDGNLDRFALMSGFAAGLMFAKPEPGPELTEAEIAEGVINLYRGMAEFGDLEATLVDDVISGALMDKVNAVVGTRDDRTITTRDAVTKAFESDLAPLTDWLRGRLVGGARHTDPMSVMSNADAKRYYEEEVQTMRWVQNFGLRRTRATEQEAAIPSYMQINRAMRNMGDATPDDEPPRPIEMCYWVVPGLLLAGEYPRNFEEASSVEKLARLTDAGVSAFIDLTEEGEGLKPYAYLLDGPSHERFGIRDQHAPRDDETTKATLDAIDRHLEAGEIVYVHCWGGVGRTGTIIGCWLSRHHEPGQPALDQLRGLWKKNPKSGTRPRSPENDEQDRYVLSWREKEISFSARHQGCLTGLAVGDAVGTTVEFKAPGTFRPVSDMVGGGPFNLQPGQWTDDTSMALCLAESLLEAEGFSASAQMDLYVRWWREGYLSSTGSFFDIGNATAAALRHYQQTGFPLAGSTHPQSAGNGSLMRLAPVAMFFADDPELAIRLCGESSRTTHGAQTCIDACRYFGGLLVGALRGVAKDELLSERYCPVPGLWERLPLCAEIEEVAAGSFKRRQPPEIVGSGYVVKSLEAALWAFHRSETFKEGCLKAVNLGDDADTTAAIYGQIAGAFYGMDGIPSGWREKLAQRELITNLAVSLRVKGRERDW